MSNTRTSCTALAVAMHHLQMRVRAMNYVDHLSMAVIQGQLTMLREMEERARLLPLSFALTDEMQRWVMARIYAFAEQHGMTPADMSQRCVGCGGFMTPRVMEHRCLVPNGDGEVFVHRSGTSDMCIGCDMEEVFNGRN